MDIWHGQGTGHNVTIAELRWIERGSSSLSLSLSFFFILNFMHWETVRRLPFCPTLIYRPLRVTPALQATERGKRGPVSSGNAFIRSSLLKDVCE